MSCSRKMRSREVDYTTDKTLISVRWANGARDIEFIIVFVVANRKLVRINPYNRSYIDMKIMGFIPVCNMRSDSCAVELLTGRKAREYIPYMSCIFSISNRYFPLWITS